MRRIEPVPIRKQSAALRHLVSGDETAGPSQAQAFGEMLHQSPPTARMWWARRGRRILGTALLVSAPGRVGFLHHSSPWADGHDPDALAELLRVVAEASLAGEDTLVQTMVAAHLRENIPILRDAGFEELAELWAMRCDLRDLAIPADEGPGAFRAWPAFTESQLRKVIEKTYEGSLDCPRLAGLRPLGDVLASHKATGVYTPPWWWLVEYEGRTGGCLLMNRRTFGSAAEVVYMGLTPSCRGKGVGGRLLAHAADQASRGGCDGLELMVDAGNAYAIRLYERFGFRRQHRRWCYARFR